MQRAGGWGGVGDLGKAASVVEIGGDKAASAAEVG
jgi:hypothetical protein